MIKNILFATDFTAITARAKDYAANVAKAMGAKMTLIHAIEPIDDATDEVQGFLESRRASAENKASALAKELAEQGIECDIKVEIGKRWQVVVTTATEGKYDLVVLGSHKIRDGEKVYLGSTTHKVFFGSDVPLLVVPSS